LNNLDQFFEILGENFKGISFDFNVYHMVLVLWLWKKVAISLLVFSIFSMTNDNFPLSNLHSIESDDPGCNVLSLAFWRVSGEYVFCRDSVKWNYFGGEYL
jgi:hypothetical protein